MALDASDVFVLQRATDGQPHFKLSLGELTNHIGSSDVVRFRGARDFTDGSEDPNVDGTGRVLGDMYINNDTGVDVANGWADMDGTVSAGDRAIWDGAKWELIRSNTSNGTLVEVRKADPIEVDAIDDPTRPIVGIRTASKGADPAVNSGAVARLATDAEVATTGTGGTDAVVTADQLRTTNIALDAATAGGVSTVIGIDPVEIFVDGTAGSATTSPAVGVKQASTTQVGVSEFVTQDEVDTAAAGYDTKVVTGDLLKTTNDVIASLDTGVSCLLAESPIEIKTDGSNGSSASEPSISVLQASTTQVGVSEFVTQAEVDAASAGYDTKVVTGDLLKATNDSIAALDTGVLAISSVNTIDVTGDATDTVIEVKPNVFLPFSFVDLPEERDL